MPRKRLSDRWLVVLLLLLLGAIAIVEQVVTFNQPDPPLSTSSDERNGASALKTWLTSLGFDLVDEQLSTFEVPADTSIIFLLEPSVGVTDDEWLILLDWVEQGGILVVSGTNFPAQGLYLRLGYNIGDVAQLSLEEIGPDTSTVQREAPFLTLTEFDGELTTGPTLSLLRADSSDNHVVHLSVDRKPLVVSQNRGEGQIIIAPETDIFSNQGLFGEANRKIVLNLAALQGNDGRIWFDEWHHGERELEFSVGEVNSPADWLRFTPSGRATLLVALLLFVFIALNGRYFGRPQPLPESLKRRGAAEYVDALATLTRQTGDTQVITTHSHTRLRRALIKRFRLDPNLTDREIVSALEKIKPAASAPAAELLTALNRKNISETDLIRTHTEIDQFIEEHL